MSIMKEDDSRSQQINEQSLTQNLEKTRELLKGKLQIRRSLEQLVNVGIIPSSKSSLSSYDQHKKLQMRKTQDILKNKILSRSNRQLLIEHNILSDTTAAPVIQKTKLKSKSCLTFHEYKGPLKKVEITKVPFLELIQNEDLKNKYKKLNICSNETKTKLIEKLKNSQNNNDEEQSEKLKQNKIIPLTSKSLTQSTNVLDDNLSSLSYMDWMTMPSPVINDNNLDLTEFDIDYPLLFDSTYEEH